MARSTITAWRERFGFSKNELIKRSGLAKTTIYRVDEEGIASAATLNAIARAFGISIPELLAGPPGFQKQPPTPLVRTINLYKGVPLMGWGDAKPGGTVKILDNQVDDPAVIAVEVAGDNMYPTLMAGDIVLVNPTVTKPAYGAIVCVVDRRTGRGFIGRYRCTETHDGLTHDNPLYPGLGPDEMKDIEILGQVLRLADRDLNAGGFWKPPKDDVPSQH